MSIVQGLAAAAAAAATAKVSFSEVAIERGESSSNNKMEGKTIGERIKFGESLLEIQDIVTQEECTRLVTACLNAAEEATPTRQLDKPGLVRLPTIAAAERAAVTQTPCADPLPLEVDQVLERILRRVMEYIDVELPSMSSTLFATNTEKATTTTTTIDSSSTLKSLVTNNQLKFSSREPAINIYTKGGEFLAHKDAQALTVLIPLSCPEQGHFSGGGTAFWSQDARGHRVEGPSLIRKPRSGTALLFGGCVTHAGVSLVSGTRVVFVASFSALQTTRDAIRTEQQRDIYGDSM